MEKLPINYKIQRAEEFTKLALENGVIGNYDENKTAAEQVCEFFQYIVENLDKTE